MKISFDIIEHGFLFASAGSPFEHEAYLRLNDGELIFVSDEIDEVAPPDICNTEKYARIPDQKKLGLGRNLVFEFIEDKNEDLKQRIYEILKKKGAYRKFRIIMENYQMLEKWYSFENRRTKEKLMKWAEKNGIEVE